MHPEPDSLEIGTVRRAHGIRGQLRVQLHDPASDALEVLARLRIGAAQGPSYEIGAVHDLGGGAYLVQLEGVADRDRAEALRGQPIFALRTELTPLAEDEFYVGDLIGCEVVTAGGDLVGRVRAVPAIGGQDLLEIERPGRKEALVPLQPAFVTAIDLSARRVEIDPPEGLLDLDLPEPKDRKERAGEGGT
jgi:16S rRNA processing protein RimM